MGSKLYFSIVLVGHGAVYTDGKFWMFGGRSNDGMVTNQLVQYNLSLNKWSPVVPGRDYVSPPALMHHTVSLIYWRFPERGVGGGLLEYPRNKYLVVCRS